MAWREDGEGAVAAIRETAGPWQDVTVLQSRSRTRQAISGRRARTAARSSGRAAARNAVSVVPDGTSRYCRPSSM